MSSSTIDPAMWPLLCRLEAAIKVMNEVQVLTVAVPEQRHKLAEMSLCLVLANSYLSELAHHMIVGGVDLYDAMLATSAGTLELRAL
ncbi:MAG: hypothetical protein ABI887_06760 [Burkholderiales bacterium]